jgi:hypothetical protein
MAAPNDEWSEDHAEISAAQEAAPAGDRPRALVIPIAPPAPAPAPAAHAETFPSSHYRGVAEHAYELGWAAAIKAAMTELKSRKAGASLRAAIAELQIFGDRS